MDRLDARLLTRLDEERDLNRRGAIQGFTQQMASLKRIALQDFLAEAFQPSRYEEPCLVRGVYLSSGTQEGTPIDRVISSISGTFGLDRQAMPAFSGPGRSYFLTRLLREVVFQEADLVGHTGFFHQHRAWLQRAAYAGAFLLLVGIAAAWVTSYLRNLDYIAEVETQVAAYEVHADELAKGSGAVAEMLKPLNAMRALPGGYDDRDKSVPLLMGVGLYQGDKLGDAARAAYRRALTTILLPQIILRLEAQMGEFANRNDLLYEALKAYLMLGNPKFLDRDFVRVWMKLDWSNQYPGAANAEVREQLEAHFAALLEADVVPPPLSAKLVSQARQILAQQPLAERVFGQIRSAALTNGLEPWRITETIGDADRYFRRKSGDPLSKGVPGLFTYAGFKDEFLVNLPELAKVASQETWVIGPEYSKLIGDTELPLLIDDVKDLYFAEYILQWDRFLDDVDIVQFRGYGDAAELMNAFSAPNSPIKRFLGAVEKQTKLASSSLGGTILQKSEEGIKNLQARLENLLGQVPENQPKIELQDPSAVVDRHFAALHAVLKKVDDEGQAPIERVLFTLNNLYEYVSLMRNRGGTPPSGDAPDVNSRLRLNAQRQPEPLATWMRSLARETQQVTLGSVRTRMNRVWQSDIAPLCRNALGNRYPLAKGSAQDANINDFSRFFGPAGKIDAFFNQYLKPYVDTSVRPWRILSDGGVNIGIPKGALSQLESAVRIKEAFFPSGTPLPSVNFQIKPVVLDKQARHVLLEFGDQQVTYRHGPTRFKPMQWPPPGGQPRAKIVITPVGGQQPVFLTTEGAWSFFRLLEKGAVRSAGQADRFAVTFTIKGLKATFEIQAGSVTNPFRLSTIRGFRCMGQL